MHFWLLNQTSSQWIFACTWEWLVGVFSAKSWLVLTCIFQGVHDFSCFKEPTCTSPVLLRWHLSHLTRLWYSVLRKRIAHAQPSSEARCLNFSWTLRLFHTSCVQTAKALARLWICAGSPGHSLVAYMISTIISGAGSFDPFHKD